MHNTNIGMGRRNSTSVPGGNNEKHIKNCSERSIHGTTKSNAAAEHLISKFNRRRHNYEW